VSRSTRGKEKGIFDTDIVNLIPPFLLLTSLLLLLLSLLEYSSLMELSCRNVYVARHLGDDEWNGLQL